MPKVSVIIPIYGVEKYIERCARSLLEQTLDDIEYIFINDCTRDSSIEILQNVIQEYPHRKKQIKIENMLTNSGQAAVRKHGIHLATGDYIIQCDSDDWVNPMMYELMYNQAITQKVDIVSCDYIETDGHNHKKICCQFNNEKHDLISKLVSQEIAVAVWNKLVRREIYKNANSIIYPTHNMGEDYVISVQLAIKSASFVHIATPLYYYYYNINSISNNTNTNHIINKWLGLNKNILLVSDILKKHNIYEEYKLEIEKTIYRYKDNIIPYIALDTKYRKIWLNMYPNFNFFTERGLKNKIRYIIIYLGLYPIMRKLMKL